MDPNKLHHFSLVAFLAQFHFYVSAPYAAMEALFLPC